MQCDTQLPIYRELVRCHPGPKWQDQVLTLGSLTRELTFPSAPKQGGASHLLGKRGDLRLWGAPVQGVSHQASFPKFSSQVSFSPLTGKETGSEGDWKGFLASWEEATPIWGPPPSLPAFTHENGLDAWFTVAVPGIPMCHSESPGTYFKS